jgi:hypothetical protein
MFIPNRQFKTTLTGSTARDIKCENCGCDYVYLIKAESHGTGVSPLCLDHEGARKRALGQAKLRLHEQLHGVHRAVPCPDCGWYQKHMVQLRKQARTRVSLAVASLPLLWVAVQWIFSSPEEPTDFHLVRWATLTLVLGAIGVLFSRTWMDNANPKARIASNSPGTDGSVMRKADYENLVASRSEQ